VVHPADIQDRDGGVLVLSTLFGPFFRKLFADGGYQGQSPAVSCDGDRERSDGVNGFEVLPKGWVGYRTNLRVARPLSTAAERLRKPIPPCFAVTPSRRDPPHATKASFSQMNFPDWL